MNYPPITKNTLIIEYPAVHKHLLVASTLLVVISVVALAIIFSMGNPFGSMQHLILFAIPGGLSVLSFAALILSCFLKPSEDSSIEVNKKSEEIEKGNKNSIVDQPDPIRIEKDSQEILAPSIEVKVVSDKNQLNNTPEHEPISPPQVDKDKSEHEIVIEKKTFPRLMEALFKPILDQGKSLLTAIILSHSKSDNTSVDQTKIHAVGTFIDSLWGFLNKLMNNESFVLKNMIFSLGHVSSKSKLFRRWTYALSFNNAKAQEEISNKLASRNKFINLFNSLKKKNYNEQEWSDFTKNYLNLLIGSISLYSADEKIDSLKKELLNLLIENANSQTLFPKKVDRDWLHAIEQIIGHLDGKENELDRAIFNFTNLIYDRISSAPTIKGTLTEIFNTLMSYMVEKSDDSETLTAFMKEQVGFLKREVDVNIRSLVAYFETTKIKDNKKVTIDKEDQIDAVHKWNLIWENLTPENKLENNSLYSSMISLQLRINRDLNKDKKIAIIALTDEELKDNTLLSFAYPNHKEDERSNELIMLQKILTSDKYSSEVTSLNEKLQSKKIYAVPCKEGDFPMLTLKKLEGTFGMKAARPFLGIANKAIDFIRKLIYIPLDLPGLDKKGNDEFYQILMTLIPLISTPGFDIMMSENHKFKKVFTSTLGTYGPIINDNMDDIIKENPIKPESIKDKVINILEKVEQSFLRSE